MQQMVFLTCLIETLKQQVIIIREDQAQFKELIEQPCLFIWDLFKKILQRVEGAVGKSHERFLALCCFVTGYMVRECCQFTSNLNHRHSLLKCLIEFAEYLPRSVFEA